MRIRPLLSRSRSRRRRARASHRRSRRSWRHRRRHHRSGMSHTITPSAHRRSLSRNHPPRPSSTVARIVISHHESKMTMRGGANETRVRSCLCVPLSRARRRSIDRVSMPPFASRPSPTPVLARTRQSHPIPSHSIPFIARAGRPRTHRLDGIARTPFHVHKHQPVHQTKQSPPPHAQKIKIKNRTRGAITARAAARPRARRLDPSIDRARIVLARSGDVDSSSRLDASLERDAFGRSVVAFDGRGRWRTRADVSRANGKARANGARDANARETEVEVRTDRGAGTGRGTRSRNARETRSSIVRGRFAEGVDSIE